MDGVVDAMDANLLLSYYYGNTDLTAMQQRAADVNGDGVIDAMDANLIISYFYGNIDKFPAEK
jgi:RNase H-fold protein (predicted Holliday junction resolvase)